MAGGFGMPENAGEPGDEVFAGEVQRRKEDRDPDDEDASRAGQPNQRRDRPVDAVEVLDHLLADDDIVALRADLGVAAGQVADKELLIKLWFVELRVGHIAGRDPDVVEMRLGFELVQHGPPAAADIEYRKRSASQGRRAGPVADVLRENHVARQAQPIALRAFRVDGPCLARCIRPTIETRAVYGLDCFDPPENDGTPRRPLILAVPPPAAKPVVAGSRLA